MTVHEPMQRFYGTEEARYFHAGLALFNAGEWFEAHEAWEEVWHMAGGEKKRFYQGLIQYAVLLVHISRGNPRGVRAVSKTAPTKFEGLPPVYMGVDVPGLLQDLDAVAAPVLAMGPEAFDPARGRGQAMPVDLDEAPRIELLYDPFEENLEPASSRDASD